MALRQHAGYERPVVEVLYKPPSQNDSIFLENLSNNLSAYLKVYDNKLRLGDFNLNPRNTNLKLFTDSFNLENLIHESTCFKGLPSCIDLIITNRKSYLCGGNRDVRFSQINCRQFESSS